MNQTRIFLILAWLMVAMLLWMEWSKEKTTPITAPEQSTQTLAPPQDLQSAIPSIAEAPTTTDATVPQAPAEVSATPAAPTIAAVDKITVITDVLHLELNGGGILEAQLLQYPQTKAEDSPPVNLLTQNPEKFYSAQSGWITAGGQAPTHLEGFTPAGTQREFKLADGADTITVPFIWTDANGVTIHRNYEFKRGQYAIVVRDEVNNASDKAWQGNIYRQLISKPLQISRGVMNPGSFSFNGAAWYSGKEGYQRRQFSEFLEDGKFSEQTTGGWISLLQHHFFSAWIPDATDNITISLDALPDGRGDIVRLMGSPIQVDKDKQASVSARLYVGPKLVEQLKAQEVPGLERAVDYSRFSIMALLGQLLFWVLNHIHSLLGNWGWSIIGLVIIIKAILYPLSAAQYKSFAKMRKVQPRMQQLKERYGDDKQKLNQAMMELYKKEKINPMGGCLPILVQMPIFFALYWVLVESVELRQAPWFAWIQDLTARDPYFILPVLNVATMWLTQKLTPSPGMDPMQARMMQIMPLAFGVMMAFFPAGLVLYWVTNGALGLLQQWWMAKKHGGPSPSKEIVEK